MFPISSALNRSPKGTQPSQKWQDKLNQAQHGTPRGTTKITESHFEDDLHHGVWSQPDILNEGPRSHRKFMQTCLGKGKVCAACEGLREKSSIWVKTMSFLY